MDAALRFTKLSKFRELENNNLRTWRLILHTLLIANSLTKNYVIWFYLDILAYDYLI